MSTTPTRRARCAPPPRPRATTAGPTAQLSLSWATDAADVGDYRLSLTASDDFAPPGQTTVDLVLRVVTPYLEPTLVAAGTPCPGQLFTLDASASLGSEQRAELAAMTDDPSGCLDSGPLTIGAHYRTSSSTSCP